MCLRYDHNIAINILIAQINTRIIAVLHNRVKFQLYLYKRCSNLLEPIYKAFTDMETKITPITVRTDPMTNWTFKISYFLLTKNEKNIVNNGAAAIIDATSTTSDTWRALYREI